MSMTVYTYDERTKFYTGTVEIKPGFDQSYAIPSNATTTPPPDASTWPADMKPVWDIPGNEWQMDYIPLDELKEVYKNSIKRAYIEAENGPFHTGVMGQAVKLGTLETIEEREVVIKSSLASRDHINLLQQVKPVEQEGLPNDGTVVLRDYDNHYIVVTREQLDQIAELQKQNALELLHRKWMLQERIEDAKTSVEIQGIHWDSDFSDIDTKGE